MIEREVGFDTELVAREPEVVAREPDAEGLERPANAPWDIRAQVRRCIGHDLAGVEKLIQTTTHSRFPEVDRLGRHASMMGGKRLRPMLVFLSADACRVTHAGDRGRRVRETAGTDLRAIAASIELVHAASLVHDDVLDSATERRHQPTVAHLSGTSSAVLLGDFLFTRAYATAASCRTTFAARQIAAAATCLCEGEMRQQLSAGNWLLTPSQYKSILFQKTGALCAVACRLGGWCGGGSREQARALSRFGNYLGLAFQVFDDWLDYWGTDRVGKTLGTDLAQLKPTLPLIRLLQTVSRHRRSQLVELLDSGRADGFAEVRGELESSDAREYTLGVARRLVERAERSLEGLPSSPAKECLLGVAKFSVCRHQ